MLRQIVHMLLDKFGTLIKRRLIVEERTRRLLVDKRIFLCQFAEKRIARKKLIQTLHASHVQ